MSSNTKITKIVSWAREAYLNGFDFDPYCKTRNSIINWMKKKNPSKKELYPKSIPVVLNDNLNIEKI